MKVLHLFSIFQVDGYRLERRDHNEFCGGIVAFVRSDIPIRRRKDLNMAQTESVLEVKINDSKFMKRFYHSN